MGGQRIVNVKPSSQEGLLENKGDLYTNDGTEDVRLGVGSNGQILKADSSQPSGLVWADESTGASSPLIYSSEQPTAIVRSDVNTNNIGTPGVNSIGLSIEDEASSTRGATGTSSFTIGRRSTAAGFDSFAGGFRSQANATRTFSFGQDVIIDVSSAHSVAIGSGNNIIGAAYSASFGRGNTTNGDSGGEGYSLVVGRDNNADSIYSFVFGQNNVATENSATHAMVGGLLSQADGQYSLAFGNRVVSESQNQITLGAHSTLVAGDVDNWNLTDRLFVLGNGTGTGSRSDAITVLKNGVIKADSLTTALIDSESSTSKILITKEYAEANYGSSNLPSDRIEVDNSVSSSKDIDWSSYETFDYVLTGDTTFSESNLPTSGTNTKVITIYLTGDFVPTWPSNWENNLTGNYDGLVLNQIVVEYISSGKYWMTISQAE